MKILYITTIVGTMEFFPAHIRMLQAAGHLVELACNMEGPVPGGVAELGCTMHHIPFSRSPLRPENLTACKQLKKLLETNRYDIIHTHTPNASACARLCCGKLRRQGLRVFYTAHGFHFYKGAPLKNWLLYYPVERLLSRRTDVLITMNREDYDRAKTFHAGRVEFVHGVGIAPERFVLPSEVRAAKRRELGIGPGELLLLSVGELIFRKNHELLLRAVAGNRDSRLRCAVVGSGPLEPELKRLAVELGIEQQVLFLGWRTDIPELNCGADLFVFPSYQEGLPVSLMEAMAAGLPVVCSAIRGNVDLIEDGKGGLFVPPNDAKALSNAIKTLAKDEPLRRSMGAYNREKARDYSTQCVLGEMKKIYGIGK